MVLFVRRSHEWLAGCWRAARFPPLLLTLLITLNASCTLGGCNQSLATPRLCYSASAKQNQLPLHPRLGTPAARCWAWDEEPLSSAPGEIQQGAASVLLERGRLQACSCHSGELGDSTDGFNHTLSQLLGPFHPRLFPRVTCSQ